MMNSGTNMIIWARLLINVLPCLLFTVYLVDHVQGSKGCLEKERLGLLELRHFVELNTHSFLPSWVDNKDANCCVWEGVRCNHMTGHVTHLILENLNLVDEDWGPEENLYRVAMNFSLLHPFEQLMYLDLSLNYFEGSVQNEGLCGLKNLQELDISHNSISSLPECMSNLTSLRVLDLSSTSMTRVQSFITNLKSLEYLSLFDNEMEGFFSFSLLANHSKLEVFRLSSSADNLLVETGSPYWLPTFQLKALQLVNCSLNAQQSSVTPSFLLYQHELKILDLSHNMLHGEFPVWLLNNNSNLEILRLTNNSFTGTLQSPTTVHGLRSLDISSNKFDGELPENIGKIFPNLSHVNLAKNNFEGSLPTSMVEMQRVEALDLSKNDFSGKITRDFFSNWTSLTFLSLSHNNFSGQVMPKFANSSKLRCLFLNNNNFFGEIYDGIKNKSFVVAMDISNNMVSGRIPGWIGDFEESLIFFLMSGNLLEGKVSDEICNLSSIIYLDLSENSLSGSLPLCLPNLRNLGFLHMQKNALEGYLPNEPFPLGIYSLDLRDNKFFGEVPNVCNDQYDGTEVLLLGGNQLSGSIPDHLCKCSILRVMDLSRNRLTGTIPSCFANMNFTGYGSICGLIPATVSLAVPIFCTGTEQVDIRFPLEIFAPSYNSTLTLRHDYLNDYYKMETPDSAGFRTKHNLYSYTGNILSLMYGLDFSSNDLNGSIPPEIGHTKNIIGLNLSHNRLSGNIPPSFSNLVKIESLDLSYNNLRGAIPPNLIALNSLAIFNVSYNNLSGLVPTARQFANFDMDNYRGNPGLFGPFLNRSSSRTMSPPPSPLEGHPSNEGAGENHKAIELASFYWGFISSYVAMILGLAVVLWFSPRWCRVWFRFVDLCIYYCIPCLFRNGFR